MPRPRKGWDELKPSGKRAWMVGRSEAEARAAYESGDPSPRAKPGSPRVKPVPKPQPVRGTALVTASESTIVDFATAPVRDLVDFVHVEQATMIRASVRMAVALAAIKRRELWKPYADDFEAYCWEEFSIRRSYLFYLLRAREVIARVDRKLKAAKLLPEGQTVAGTVIVHEWQARQLDGYEDALITRIKKGELPNEAVDATIAEAKRMKERRKEVVGRVAPDDDDEATDELVPLTSLDGKTLHATRASDGRMLVGTPAHDKLVEAVVQHLPDNQSTAPPDKSITVEPSWAACTTETAETLAKHIERDVRIILGSRYVLSVAVRDQLHKVFTEGLAKLEGDAVTDAGAIRNLIGPARVRRRAPTTVP